MIARWQLDGNLAAIISAAADAKIDLARPEQGLAVHLSDQDRSASPLQILGVALADPLNVQAERIDAYTRGTDLVVIFGETPTRRLRLQVYWRNIAPEDFAASFAPNVVIAFDLILSSNTSLLDSDPQSNVRSLVPSAAQMMHWERTATSDLQAQQISLPQTVGNSSRLAVTPQSNAAGCFLTRFNHIPFSYVEMVHPADFCASTVTFANTQQTAEPSALIEHQLFRQRLEKGVILRAMVRSAVIARHDDEAAAVAAFKQFAATEPPLTT
jgi:hypothetical protein